MNKLPLARNTNIVVQHLKDETLIYDLVTHKAYCLNKTSAIVFNACGDGMSFDDLKRKHKFTDDLIYLALDSLQKDNLIESDQVTHFAGLSRREVIRRVGLASMITLPICGTFL